MPSNNNKSGSGGSMNKKILKARISAARASKDEKEISPAVNNDQNAIVQAAIQAAMLAAQEAAKKAAAEAAEKAAREEQERLAREAAEKAAREEAERLAREAAEKAAREEQERLAREAAEKAAREEQERLAREAAEKVIRSANGGAVRSTEEWNALIAAAVEAAQSALMGISADNTDNNKDDSLVEEIENTEDNAETEDAVSTEETYDTEEEIFDSEDDELEDIYSDFDYFDDDSDFEDFEDEPETEEEEALEESDDTTEEPEVAEEPESEEEVESEEETVSEETTETESETPEAEEQSEEILNELPTVAQLRNAKDHAFAVKDSGIPLTMPSEEAINEEKKRLTYRKRFIRTVGRIISVMLNVAAISVLIAVLLLPVLRIYGSSMTPTLTESDLVLSIKGSKFETGDVIAFYFNNKVLVKRVIAQAGDWVSIDPEGTVSVNGAIINEPYVQEKAFGECDLEFPYQVPEGRVFVMGDHRDTSVDSRSSVIGCVAEEQIVGKIVFRLWPIKEIGAVN